MKKKIFLGLSSLTSLTIPVAAIVACNPGEDFSFKKDLELLQNTVASKDKNDLMNDLGNKKMGDVLSPKLLGYKSPTFSSGVVINKIEVVAPYNSTTNTVKVKISLKKGSIFSKSKEITVTAFTFNDALQKIVDTTSTLTKTELNANIGSKTTGNAVTLTELGYVRPKNLASDIKVVDAQIKTVYNNSSGEVVVEVKLAYGNYKTAAFQTIKITAKTKS